MARLIKVTNLRPHMAPYCEQRSRDSENSAILQEINDIPSPLADTLSPLSSATPSPPPPPVEEAVDNQQQEYEPITYNLNPIPTIHSDVPDYLPIDHNLPQLLRQVTGTNDLRSVRQLKLRVISHETSLQRLCLYMPALQELNLSGSCLGSLRDLGCGLTNLLVLKVNRCGLDSLDGTFGLTSLHELHAAFNSVEDVSPCTSLPDIKVIDLHKNRVHDLGYVSFLSFCANLRSLNLSECPVATQQGYREDVRQFLPQLVVLDDVPFGEEPVPSIGICDKDFDDDKDDDDLNESNEEENATSNQNHESQNNNLMPNSEKNKCSNPSDSDTSHLNSSSHQASSDTSLICNKGAIKKQPKRPSTASVDRRACGTVHRKRPATVAPTNLTSARHAASNSSTSVPDFRNDAPSALTSGTVVYGNLTAILRGRKCRIDAWGELPNQRQADDKLQKLLQEKQEADLVSTGLANLLLDKSVECGDKGDLECLETKEMSASEEETTDEYTFEGDVLEMSRHWRELYTTYRSKNRARWEKEELEDNELEKKQIETHRKVIKKVQDKDKQPCCSMLFSPQLKLPETSYADIRNNISPEPNTSEKETGVTLSTEFL